MNLALLATVLRFQPDLILTVPITYEIWKDTWELITRQTPACTFYWAADDSWKYRQMSRLVASAFDVCVTTYPEIAQLYSSDGHQNVRVSQWGIARELSRQPKPGSACRWQVTFIGTANPLRRAVMARLAAEGIEVACFGHGWPRGAVPARAIPEIVNDSFLCLNFADGAKPGVITSRGPQQIKARAFEITGMGSTLINEYVAGIESFFSLEDEVLTFGNLGDLVSTIRAVVADRNRRDRIAWNGYRKTVQCHTYQRRFRELFQLGDFAADAKLSWAAVDEEALWKDLRTVAALHATSRWQRYLARGLAWATAPLVGRAKAPSAARRLLYELSWRIGGDQVYRSSGYPGRLFYGV